VYRVVLSTIHYIQKTMSCNFDTLALKKIDQSNFELPADAGDIVQITYADGTVMPSSIWTFLAPRLIQLSCPLPTEFSCIYATYTPYQWVCEKATSCCN